MFAVGVCIYTDGDFGYKEPEFNTKGDEEKTFYFETREEAVGALVRSFHNLKNSLRPCGFENIKRWVDKMDNKIELITKKIPAFIIRKEFGNQSIHYELVEVKKIEMSNGSYYYNSSEPYVDLSVLQEDTSEWDYLAHFPDV